MTNLEKDMNSLLCDMRNEQALDKYYKYIKLKKNIIFCNDENTIIQKEKNTILSKQAQKEKIIKQELEIFDSFDIPFIGMKGPFLKSEYYESIPRVYNDLDLLVESINVSEFYNLLRKNELLRRECLSLSLKIIFRQTEAFLFLKHFVCIWVARIE